MPSSEFRWGAGVGEGLPVGEAPRRWYSVRSPCQAATHTAGMVPYDSECRTQRTQRVLVGGRWVARGDVEEEAFDDVGDAMGRRGDARPGAWRTNEVSNAAGKDAWKSREWTRVAGTGDAAGALDVDEEVVQDTLLKRD